jgi:branched-chain amino acid transport system substrate-binding protein
MDIFPDDRQQGYPLADIIFKELDLKRVGVLRTNSRYARIGVGPLTDYARRIGRQVVLEAKFDRGDTDFTKQLRMLEARKIDGLVIWAEAREAALAVKQMRALGMKQPVFASSRVAYPEFLELAGPAAEGVTVAAGLDPTREDPAWNKFRTKFVERWGYEPDPYAAYAYDGIVILTEAIERAGLNRGRIMEVLRGYQMKEHHGVAGRYFFDHTLNNIAPVTLGRVENGKFVYWTAPGRDPLEPVVAQKQE